MRAERVLAARLAHYDDRCPGALSLTQSTPPAHIGGRGLICKSMIVYWQAADLIQQQPVLREPSSMPVSCVVVPEATR